MNKTTTFKNALCRWLAALALCLCFHGLNAQNSCSSPQTIVAGTYAIAGIDGTNIGTTCSDAAMAEWFAYTPTANYSVTVSSDLPQNICKDTHFMVYTGSCSGLACYTSDDDSGVIQCNSGNNNSYLSKKTFDVFAGVTYYIVWDNRWSAAGFDFQLTEAPMAPSACSMATPITAGTHTVTALNGLNVTTACSSSNYAAKWYRYTPSDDFHLTITSDLPQNLCKDTYFAVYTGTCSTGLTCIASDDNSGTLACNSGNTNSNLSKKTFDVEAGMTYYIAWDSRWGTAGFDFQIIEEEIVLPLTFNTVYIPTLSGGDYNICVVDMNGDGLDDIASVGTNVLRLHHQGANGQLTPSSVSVPGTSFMPSWSLAAGDYNRDGFTDLVLGSGSGLSFWKSNGSGTDYSAITPGQYIFCQRTNFVDLNGDGHLDAFSCHDIAPNCYYVNDGSGNMNFFQSAGIFGNVGGNYASIWTDYNNDGKIDLFVSKCSGPPCELHRNNGDGTFTNVASAAGLNYTPVSSWSSAVFDFDNDGDMDILIGSNGSSPTRLYRNELGTGAPDQFTNVTSGSGWDTDNSTNRDYIAYDFDNDGYVDVLAGGNKIMFNNGNGTFTPTAYPGLGVGAVGDLNNDGFLDILLGATVKYSVPNGNNYLKVALSGVQSNINGIGARVKITGPWGVQIRDIRSGEGFEYMSTLNAHFGLGTSTQVDMLEIHWPSGVVDYIPNPQINSAVQIQEGSAPLAVSGSHQDAFRIYPNPVRDRLTVSLGQNIDSIQSIEVIDMTGRLVLSPKAENGSFSVKELSNGTYIVMIRTSDGKTMNQKFVKN